MAHRRDLSALRKQVESSGVEAGWFFASSTGWLDGAPNVRAVVNARPIARGMRGTLFGPNADHVPDPPLPEDDPSAPDPESLRFMQGLPIFTDPLRVQWHDFGAVPIRRPTPDPAADGEPGTAAPPGVARRPADPTRTHAQYATGSAGPDASERPGPAAAREVNLVGVHTCVGRYDPNHKKATDLVRPWNVVEPILWLARETEEDNPQWFRQLRL